MRAEKAWPVCDHCAKERPQPRDAHLTEHPFPAQSDPQVAFARSFNRRHHRSHGGQRRVIEPARTVARYALREVGRGRDKLREAALGVEQLHFGVSYAAATSSAAVTKPAAWC